MTILTPTAIFDRVKRTFGDSAGVQVVEADIIRWINDAQKEAVMQHENLLVTEAHITTAVGDPTYTLPSDCFVLLHVWYRKSSESAYYPMRFVPVAQMNIDVPGWLGPDTGFPVIYTKGPDHDEITIYPAPNEVSVDGIKYRYSRYPTDITVIGGTIDLPEYYHSYVEHFCMMKAYEMDEDWPSHDRKAQLIQSIMDESRYRESWFGREVYPSVVDHDE